MIALREEDIGFWTPFANVNAGSEEEYENHKLSFGCSRMTSHVLLVYTAFAYAEQHTGAGPSRDASDFAQPHAYSCQMNQRRSSKCECWTGK